MSDLIPADFNTSDAERAAVMIMLLEDDQASALLGQLDPAELRLLGEHMVALGEISPVAIEDAIARFVEKTERMGMVVPDRVGQVRQMMTRAIGEVKTDSLMQRIAPEARTERRLPLTSPARAGWLEARRTAPA